MRSSFQLVSAICGWCSAPTECVSVDFENGSKMDLCWKCLRSKAKAEAKHVPKPLPPKEPELSVSTASAKGQRAPNWQKNDDPTDPQVQSVRDK